MLNIFKNPPQPKPITQQDTPAALPQTDCDDNGVKQRQCFAIVRALKIRFVQKGISENALWCWALAAQGKDVIGSRSQFEVVDWTHLAARLHTAQQHPHMFEALCEQIHKQGNCRVYRINPDQSEVKVYDYIFEKSVYQRCQRHADATGCTVRLHAYGDSESFEPTKRKLDPNTPPIRDVPIGASSR